MSVNPGSKSKKKNFSLQEKYGIILNYEEKGLCVKVLQAKFGCGKTQIYRMIKQRDEIKAEYLSGTKNPKTKRSVKCTPNHAINNKVLKWYRETKAGGGNVGGVAIKAKALEVGQSLGLDGFKASNGWLQSFQRRNNISLSANNQSMDLSPIKISNESRDSEPLNDPLHADDDDIVTDQDEVDEAPVDSKPFHHQRTKLEENFMEIDTTIGTICETVLYYNTLPDDVTGMHTDRLTILFCYYDDGKHEKPLITLNEANYDALRKQFFNNFIVKSTTTGLLTLQYLIEYLTILNSKLAVNSQRVTLRMDKKFERFTFGHLPNVELVFVETNGGAIVTDFKLLYRNLLLNAYIPFACNTNTKKLTFLKHFDVNDAIKLILKSIDNVDFVGGDGDGTHDMLSALYDKMVICKFSNLNTEDYLNVDSEDIVWDGGAEVDSDDEDAIISLSKATIYLIEIKKMLMKRGGDDRLIDKVDELQSDLNEMCFEEKRLNLI